MPKAGGLKLSVLDYDAVILSEISIEIELSVGLFAKQGKNVFIPSFSSFRKLRIKIFYANHKRPRKRKNSNTYLVGVFVCKVCNSLTPCL